MVLDCSRHAQPALQPYDGRPPNCWNAEANAIVTEALRLGQEGVLLLLTVVTLDSGVKLIAMHSEDGSGLLCFDIALGKAWRVLGVAISRRFIRNRLVAHPTFQAAFAAGSDGQLIPAPGGVLV